MPAPSERVPAPLERAVPEVVHPVQYGIVLERIALRRPDDKILSGYDEDVSSTRDGYPTCGVSDPGSTLLRHLVSKGSANPVCRDAHDRRHFSPLSTAATTASPTVYSSTHASAS